jgi:UDP-GlcNAc3NAcA epimerase
MSLERDKFVLATIHRDMNTDDTGRLESILSALKSLAEEYSLPFVMPFHPRTMNSLKTGLKNLLDDLMNSPFIRIIPPVSYLAMTFLEKTCRMIITDSGGVQKESHFFKKPCIVLRKETEWIELVANGTVKLVDANPELIRSGFAGYTQPGQNLEYPGFYGDGKTAEFILKEILLLFEK